MPDLPLTPEDRALLRACHISADGAEPELTPQNEVRLWQMLAEQTDAADRQWLIADRERRRGNRLKRVGKRAIRALDWWRVMAVLEGAALAAVVVTVWRVG